MRRTHCPHCPLGCGMRLEGSGGMAGPSCELRFAGAPDFPVNAGALCSKGLAAGQWLQRPGRLAEPRVRNSFGRMQSATWTAALDELAGRLVKAGEQHGPESVAVLGGGVFNNEQAYLFDRFARVALGTPNIAGGGLGSTASGGRSAAPQELAFGIDRGLPFPVGDVADAEVVVLWGSGCADSMPPVLRWFDAQRANGGSLVVVDPGPSPLAAGASSHVALAPGSDLALANGLLHVALVDDLVDVAYVATRTCGFEEVRQVALEWTPDRVEQVTGVSGRQLHDTVHALARADRAMVLSSGDLEQQPGGGDAVLALTNLMLALGKVGRVASGYGSLGGPARAGRSADEVVATLGSDAGPLAVLAAGADVVGASREPARVVHGLRGLDFLGVLDAFPSATSELADIVLPVAQWAEVDGTATTFEGRVVRRRKVVEPPDGVRTELEIIASLAGRMGHEEHFPEVDPAGVFAELAQSTAGANADLSGMTWGRLDGTPDAAEADGIFWPCPAEGHPGTPRLFAERFAHPDGRARLVPVGQRGAATPTPEATPTGTALSR